MLTGNSPFCNTGYGIKTAELAYALKSIGHEVAFFAYYGHGGALFDWNGIPVYPNDVDDYGAGRVKDWYDHFKADIVITHVDIWVMREIKAGLNWYPWTPIDHEPMPPLVRKTLLEVSSLRKPIAMSRYGQKEMVRIGVPAYYCPQMVNTSIFRPVPEQRESIRKNYGFEDKFVIGSVGTNVRERKNWTAMFLAMKEFVKKHKDAILYCHTNPVNKTGRNLMSLRESLMLQEHITVPNQIEQTLGIPPDKMALMYNMLDVYLQPSKGEGFGIPIIEAQACGLPVIVSNNTAQPELVGGGWILKDMRPEWTMQNSWEGAANPDEIVEYLEQAYQMKKDGSIAKLQQKARTKAMKYDIINVIQKHWIPTLEDIEKHLHDKKYGEGQLNPDDWRQVMIPETCTPAKVLDIGCGLKQVWKPHLKHLGDYVGIDIRGGNGYKAVQMDAHSLKYPDKSFGFAWSTELLEHVDNPQKVVNEAKRVANHGAIIFCTPTAADFKGDPDHREVKDVKYAVSRDGHGVIVW